MAEFGPDRAAARSAARRGCPGHPGAPHLSWQPAREPDLLPARRPNEEVEAALATVEAAGWAAALPGGLDCVVGSGRVRLSAAQAQQVALARLILADSHTLILDEATSLLDPRSARRLERSMAAALDGRTVAAIAHRPHTRT